MTLNCVKNALLATILMMFSANFDKIRGNTLPVIRLPGGSVKKVLPALLVFSALVSWGQSTQATAYLDPNSLFSPEFTAAIQSTVTTDAANAQYLVNFNLANNNGSVVQGITNVLTTGTYDTGAWDRATIQVVDAHSKNIIFSYTCKKYSQNSSDPAKSVAECLAKHWKSQMGK